MSESTHTGAPHKEFEMKYMIMMFGSAEGMMETADPAWIQEMIGFMIQIDKDLTESGEMVFNAGLADGSTAKLIKQTPPTRHHHGRPVRRVEGVPGGLLGG